MTTPTRTPTEPGPSDTSGLASSSNITTIPILDPTPGIVGAAAPLLFVLEFTDRDGNVTGGVTVPAKTPESAIAFARCNGAGTAHVHFTGIVLIHRNTTGQEAA